MTNQEVVQALQEYIQLEHQLTQLSQQKARLEKEIKHFQIQREPPKPQKPSKIGTFLTDFVICFAASFILACFLSQAIPGISPKILLFLWLPFGSLILPCVLTPIHYKRKDSDACARYVMASMRYKEWEEGKRNQLPILQNQLRQVMDNGRKRYQEYQNASVRTFLHADYLPYAKTILGYFERGRVRDLTEAVNLLERELLEHKRDMETAAYRDEMRRQAQAQTLAAEEAAEQSRQAAATANEAAFWGAAATFAAANSKKGDNGDYRVV